MGREDGRRESVFLFLKRIAERSTKMVRNRERKNKTW